MFALCRGSLPTFAAMPEVDAPETVYLVKWMDFSSKYGIGYLLSDRSSGFYFNDGTSLILSPDRRYIWRGMASMALI